ncbi:MAG: hypothetical protein R6X19_01895 [Kiritimatiellia bacterium]
MNPILSYLWDGVVLSGKELVLLFGPALVLGLALHYLAEVIRVSCLRLMSFNIFAWLTAPGTVVHELGHAFFCLLFGHEIRAMAIFTPNAGESLGHVKHAYNPRNPYQMMGHFFIGSGPIWFGALVLYGLAFLMMDKTIPLSGVNAGFSPDDFPGTLGQIAVSGGGVFLHLFDASLFRHWPVYAFLYLAFSIGAHMTLSVSDLGGTLKGFAVLALLVVLMNWATLWTGAWSEKICLFLMGGFSVIYGMMAFAALLSAFLAVLFYSLAVLGDRKKSME